MTYPRFSSEVRGWTGGPSRILDLCVLTAQPVGGEQGPILLLGGVGDTGGSQPDQCILGGTSVLGHSLRFVGKGSDPHALLPAGVKKRTKVIKNNVNPVWNEVRGGQPARGRSAGPGCETGKVPQAQGACGGALLILQGCHSTEGLGLDLVEGSFVPEIRGVISGGTGLDGASSAGPFAPASSPSIKILSGPSTHIKRSCLKILQLEGKTSVFYSSAQPWGGYFFQRLLPSDPDLCFQGSKLKKQRGLVSKLTLSWCRKAARQLPSFFSSS